MKFGVETRSLRQALAAVPPHVTTSADYQKLYRVRVVVDADALTIEATNGYTAAQALVDVVDNGDGEIGRFDLSPGDVKKIVMLFKAGRDDIDASLAFEVTDEHVEITDVSGLFVGQSLSLPTYPVDPEFPNVGEVLQAAMTRAAEGAPRLLAGGRSLSIFLKAAAAYDEPLVLDPAGSAGSLLITCGPSFVGVMLPLHLDEDESRRIDGWHREHVQRIANVVPF